ncbi:MAG: beta-phosphoglucomutase, partial [Alphaproteobacteria bacterium]|nr:beta-phosphoglucomutase [Alphaproteobacteria bacterium]
GAPNLLLPHAYVRRPIAYHEAFTGYALFTDTRILCPSPVAVNIYVDRERIDFAQATLLNADAALDLASGQLARTTCWRLSKGREIEIVAHRLVPLTGAPQIAQRLRISAVNFSGLLEVEPCFAATCAHNDADGDDPRIAGRYLADWQITALDAGHSTLFSAGGIDLVYQQQVTPTIGGWSRDRTAHIGGQIDRQESLAFDRIVTITSAATAAPKTVSGTSYNDLARAQQNILADFWSGASVHVAGSEKLNAALNYSLFQLFQSASQTPEFGLAAKGLTGEGYEGHCFWDAEAFGVPVLSFTAPALARTQLEFRIGKLDAARANARALGHKHGALYPWRTIAGGECSAHYPTGAAQYHINGAIAWAVSFYSDVTGDDELRADAAEMLFETARIWIEIGRHDARRGNAFCIYEVTGPDEYSALVDNDYYTNAVARHHLNYAAETADWLRNTAPAAYAQRAASLGLDETEIARWRAAAAQMWLSVDPVTGVSPQDDAFLGKPEFPLRNGATEKSPLLLHFHPMMLFRHQICKQGDVVQAMAMGLVELPLTLQARNLAYYGARTTHDSTLSAPAFAIGTARTGNWKEAEHFLNECAFVDLKNLHGNTGHGLHMAALAGSWLTIAMGWAGLTIAEGALHFAPLHTDKIGDYSFRLRWHGAILEVLVDQQGAHYQLCAGEPFTLYDHGRAVRVTMAGATLACPNVKAIIFDLDGVLTDTAELHYQAWSAWAGQHGLAFDRALNERLRGVDRAGSLRIILAHNQCTLASDEFTTALADKNRLYGEALSELCPEALFPGVRALFSVCRRAGLKIALASASRNAPQVLKRLGIVNEFDFIADAGAVEHPKPAPDIFLACASALGVAPHDCVGVEDAQAGIDAIRAAGMSAIGIGTPGALQNTDLSVQTIGELAVSEILRVGEAYSLQNKSLTPIFSGEGVS